MNRTIFSFERFSLPMNLILQHSIMQYLMKLWVQGFNARKSFRGILTPALSRLERENSLPMVCAVTMTVVHGFNAALQKTDGKRRVRRHGLQLNHPRMDGCQTSREAAQQRRWQRHLRPTRFEGSFVG